MMFDSIPHWFSRRTLKGLKLSDRYTGVRAARDIAYPPGRGLFKLAAWPPLDRVGPLRRIRPGVTLLEFGS